MNRLLLALLLLVTLTSGTVITPDVVIVDSSADLQAAVDALPAGATLRLGAGTFTAPDGGLVLSHSIAIIGDAQPSDFDATYTDAGVQRMGTVIVPYEQGDPVVVFDPDSSYGGAAQMSVRLENVVIDGEATAATTGGYGIYSKRADGIAYGEKMQKVVLSNVTVVRAGDTGIYLGRDSTGNDVDRAIVGLTMDRVEARSCYGYGIFVEDATVAAFRDCQTYYNSYSGIYLKYVGATLDNCSFESNCKDSLAGAYYDAQLYADQCNRISVIGCHFENFDGAPRGGVSRTGRMGMHLYACLNAHVDRCLFTNGSWDGMTPATPVRWYTYPDPVTNCAIYLRSCEDYSIGTNKFERCYVGVGAPPAGDAPNQRQFRPGRVDVQQTYDYYGYGCYKPFYQIAGTRMATIDTTEAFKYPLQSDYPSGGTMFWDTTGVGASGDGKLVIWTGNKWVYVSTSDYTRATP